MFGSRLSVNVWLCKPEFVRWKRVSRNNRLNKKWRKKYGPVVRCRGQAFQIDGHGFAVCPCVNAQLQKVADARRR